MERKSLFVCLIIINCVDSLYTDNQSNNDIEPAFSVKTDICKATGQSLEVNCSIPYKNPPQQNDFSETLNCSTTDQTIPYNNCSGSKSLTFLDINRLNILHCTSSNRGSCFLEEYTKTSENTIRLYKSHLKESDTGTYFCQYNNISLTEDNFGLSVGSYPAGPDNISCVSRDLLDLQCSWKKSQLDKDNPLSVRYKSYFKSRSQYGEFDCPKPKQVADTFFRDDIGCSLSDKFNSGYNYTLCINLTNCIGTQTLQHNVSMTKIVKLSPPNVTSVEVEDRSIDIYLGLKSNTKRALVTIMKILYNVTYVSEYSSHVMIFNSSEKKYIKVVLDDLIPFTTYHVTIRCRGPETEGDNYWSHLVTNSYTTKSAAPIAVPEVPPGGFSIYRGFLNIYMKPLSRKDTHAANTSYKIEVKNNHGILRLFNVDWDSTTIENITAIERGSNYQIAIRTHNIFGESNNSTLVTIPAIMAERSSMDIIVERTDFNYTILWQTKNIKEFEMKEPTVYWCHGVRSNNLCKSDFHWISVPNDLTNVTIPHLSDKSGGEWLFAVSFQYRDGYNTGMVFAKCYFSSINEAPLKVEPFNVVVTSSTELQITPLLYCKYTNRPLQFIVYYKESENNVKTCDQSFQTKMVTANANTSSIVLRSLEPSAKYAVCLSVMTQGGFKISDVHMVHMHSTDSKLIYMIPSVIVAVLVISGGMFLICKCRKSMQKSIPIELPKIVTRKYERVSISRPEFTPNPEKYSNDSGVSSNTISADLTTSNSSIHENESKNDINEHVTNLPSKQEKFKYSANLEIQEVVNGYFTPDTMDYVQSKENVGTHKHDKGYVTCNDGIIPYPKLTFTSSGLDNNSLSNANCSGYIIKEDLCNIVENEGTNKTTFDYYLSNGTENSGKRTSEINLSDSQIIPTEYPLRENELKISLLLEENSFDQINMCDESMGEIEDINIHSKTPKGTNNSSFTGYVQIGL